MHVLRGSYRCSWFVGMSYGEPLAPCAISLQTYHTGEIVNHLLSKGIGTPLCPGTHITVLDVGGSNPAPPDARQALHRQRIAKKAARSECYQVSHCRVHGHSVIHWLMGAGGRTRGTVEDIYKQVSSGAERTFNFTVNVGAASVIAGVGIAANSSVSTVASMLISPLMGPILAIAFGFTIMERGRRWDEDPGKQLLALGCLNTTLAVLQVWLLGFMQGFLYAFWAREFNWPTPEMTGRGEPMNLLAGLVVATASGFVVGVAITGGGINALVGVAISASLLPPIVNCGICTAFAIIGPALFDCLGTSRGTFGYKPRRNMPVVVNGTTFMVEQDSAEVCTLQDCGAWSLSDLQSCNDTMRGAESCACRYGAQALDGFSPWVTINVLGTPKTFDEGE